ncbi:hypothetical protein KBC75_03565 [Candidatus Shapirobacteria bacterium]|nr:hypothetical protein [Candidatus Shapirobacteria bacterium]
MPGQVPFIEITTTYRNIPYETTPVGKFENFGGPVSSPLWIVKGDFDKHRPPILKFKPNILTPETDLQQHLMEGCKGILLPTNGRVKLVPIDTGPIIDYVIVRNF